MLLRINHATEVASTGDGTLRLQEDAIGLLAVAYLDDDAGGRELLQAFRAGRCTGGSFMFSLNEVRLERAGLISSRDHLSAVWSACRG